MSDGLATDCFHLASRIVVSTISGRRLPAFTPPEVHLLLRGAAPPQGLQTLAGAAAPIAAAAPRGRSLAPDLARKSHVHSHRPFRIKFRLYRTERNTLKQSTSPSPLSSSLPSRAHQFSFINYYRVHFLTYIFYSAINSLAYHSPLWVQCLCPVLIPDHPVVSVVRICTQCGSSHFPI